MIFTYSKLWNFIIYIVLLFLISCDRNAFVTSDYIEFDERGMIKDNDYIFYPFKNSSVLDEDTLEVILSVRFDLECKISELPIKAEYLDSSIPEVIIKEIFFELFTENKPEHSPDKIDLGVYEEKKTIISNLVPDKDFFISLSTDQKDTKGILSIGVITKPKDTISNETYFRRVLSGNK